MHSKCSILNLVLCFLGVALQVAAGVQGPEYGMSPQNRLGSEGQEIDGTTVRMPQPPRATCKRE